MPCKIQRSPPRAATITTALAAHDTSTVRSAADLALPKGGADVCKGGMRPIKNHFNILILNIKRF